MSDRARSDRSTEGLEPRIYAAFIEQAGSDEASPGLARRLLVLYDAGRLAWPAINLSPAEFGAHLGVIAHHNAGYTSELESVRGDDMFIAAACATGTPGAREAFVKGYLGRIAQYVSRVDSSPSFCDEVRQELATKLLVPEDGKGAKLVTYTGRGPLAGFVRVAAVRLAQNKKRGRKLDTLDEARGDAPAASSADPEMQYFKEKYAYEFSEAFKATLLILEPAERDVLKLHYLEGLSIEDVGVRCGVSRATAARWLAKARERVLEETTKRLRDRLGQSANSPASLLGMVKSRLDLSLSKHFRRS